MKAGLTPCEMFGVGLLSITSFKTHEIVLNEEETCLDHQADEH